MARILTGRWTADLEGDFEVFILGFRASPSWKIVRALPLLSSLPKMLDDLAADPDKGMLGYQTNGPFGAVVQYWRSFEALERYARSSEDRHSAVWRDWYRRAQHLNPAVGIWHETFTVRAGEYEAIYQGMPEGFGLLGAAVPHRLGGDSRAAQRMGVDGTDLPSPTG